MQVGAVILAWHYAIDGYAGALCAVAAWGLAGVVVRSGERRVVPAPLAVTGRTFVGPTPA
jgi:hypothetical protein